MSDRRACVAIVCIALASWLFSGCGATLTDTRRRLAAIDATAITVGGFAEVVHVAAAAEARACLHDDPCLDALEARWAPADAAINSAALALGAWLTAEIVGTGDLSGAMAAALRLAASIPAALLPYGITLGGSQ